jgi:hypothetical protein
MMLVTTVGLLGVSIGLGLVLARATLDVVFRFALNGRSLLSRSL